METTFSKLEISLPTDPIMLGNLQFSFIIGLSIFDFPKIDTLALSKIYYLYGIGINILLFLKYFYLL